MLWWIPSPLAGWPALRLGAAGLANLGLLAAQLLLLDPIPRSERPDFCVAHTVQDFVQVLCQEESMCVWGGRGEVRREKWLPNTYPLSAYLLCEPGLIS